MKDEDKNIISIGSIRSFERRKQMAARSPSSEKLSEALKLLDEAATDKKDEIQGLINERYQNLRSTLLSFEPHAREKLEDLTHTAREAGRIAKARTREAAQQLDSDVHRRPWNYVGGAAVAALILGYFMGRK